MFTFEKKRVNLIFMNNEFKDIRPYSEEEYPVVLNRVITSPYLLDAIRKIKWPKCPWIFKEGANLLIKNFVKRQLKDITTREEFQKKLIIGKFMKWIIENTTKGLSFSGQENLKRDKAYLYISNHRDIVLDVAFISCVMTEIDFSTLEIAIGDNLLVNQFVEDLIRINRSFIVKRDLPPREQIAASIKLSKYMNYTMGEGNSIWIAQREGRAKDGEDLTNPAIIKMIYLSKRKSGIDFSEYINSLNIVPVAISYELDPLDTLKGWELYRKKTLGEHKKRKYEDLVSMYFGIKGKKGRVHLSFGEPLKGDFPTDRHVADAIDGFIKKQYKVWPTNYIAHDTLNKREKYTEHYSLEERDQFLRRFRSLPASVREIVLGTYAVAVDKQNECNGVFPDEGF